ncbi:MAG: hypothetical protein ACRC5A_01585, partial [Enterobacteriaceae bacterium]
MSSEPDPGRTVFNRSDLALWRIALPMIFSNITIPLLG